MKFLFTCGGTAGHINPAISVAGRLRQLLPDCEILFVGAKGMMETELVPREGYEIKTVEISNLSRHLDLEGLKHNLHTLALVVHATKEAQQIMEEFQPDVVIGTGGYVCYPVLKAAHAMHLPTLVHESNAVPGLTTRMLSHIVDCVMVGFEEAGANYPHAKRVVFTGTPVRDDFHAMTKAQAKRALGLDEKKPLLLSVWGSLGSDHMNGLMPDFMKKVCEEQRFNMIHSAGRRGYAKLSAAAAEKCGGDLRAKGVDLREYIYNMPTVMAAADLVMCRSGASTLGELAALGLPAILVPSPNVTNHHQEKNANVLRDCGAAEVFLEGSFSAESLYDAATELLRDGAKLSKMGAAMQKTGVSDATEKIAGLILDYVK